MALPLAPLASSADLDGEKARNLPAGEGERLDPPPRCRFTRRGAWRAGESEPPYSDMRRQQLLAHKLPMPSRAAP